MTDYFDFPRSLPVKDQIVWASAHIEPGRISRAGFETDYRIPGGRNMLEMRLATIGPANIHLYHWLCNVLPGAVMAVPIDRGGQVVSSDAITAAQKANPKGVPFSTDELFSTGYGFKYVPVGQVVETASVGSSTIKIDFPDFPGLLTYGKVFGVGFGVYHVQDISWDGTEASITFNPPLRRNVLSGEVSRLFPILLCRAVNPESLIGAVRFMRFGEPGSVIFREVIDDDLL